MAQFDVYRLADGELAVDVQTDLIEDFDSRVVVPLMLPGIAPVAHRRLNPTIEVEGRAYVMVSQFIIAVDRRELGRPIANVKSRYDSIKTAFDMIFLGF